MSFFKNLFGKKVEPIKSYSDFWQWFQQNEKYFHDIVKLNGKVEKDFFNILSSKLNELKEGFYFLVGMYDDDTVELVFTPDGVITNIVFVEEIVSAAPVITGWRFTALKPELDISNVYIKMGNLYFSKDNINFYSNEDDTCTDLIDITIVHDDFSEENKSAITNGSYIFLDNFLGELNFTTIVDDITVIGRVFANKELVPIEKLKDYLIWREKEFVEKYEGFRHDTENDNYAMLNAELKNGNALVAVINTDILEWDSKASHPWILKIEIFFDGSQNNGMPDNDTYILLDEIEDQILEELKDLDGYLNIGRQTADNVREIYFACKDFRKPSKVLFRIEQRYLNRNKISYTIYKDKYWQSFDRFRNVNTV